MPKSLATKSLYVINEALSNQYKEIGSFLKELGEPYYYTRFMECFKDASEDLKKPVISAWFLKCSTIWLTLKFIKEKLKDSEEFTGSDLFKKLSKKVFRLIKGMGVTVDLTSVSGIEQVIVDFDPSHILRNLKHFLSFGIEEIEGYSYGGKHPEQVIGDLTDILQKFQAREDKFFVDEDEEFVDLGKDVFKDYLVFPDGWKWVWKHTSSCDFESKYGGEGHCGTAGESDQELLSLREPVEGGKYKIWATFSIDPDGYLVQRKGTTEDINKVTGKIRRRIGNQKPIPEIHKYIYELLVYGHEHGDIKGLTSDSDYASENDFTIEDLENKEWRDHLNRIMDEKTFYSSTMEEFEAQGLTDRLGNMFVEETELNNIMNEDGHVDNGNIPVYVFDSFDDVANTFMIVLSLISEYMFIDLDSESGLYDAIDEFRDIDSSEDIDFDAFEERIIDRNADLLMHIIRSLIVDIKSYVPFTEIFNLSEDDEDMLESSYREDGEWLFNNKREEMFNFLDAVYHSYSRDTMFFCLLKALSNNIWGSTVDLGKDRAKVYFSDRSISDCLFYAEDFDETPLEKHAREVRRMGRYNDHGHLAKSEGEYLAIGMLSINDSSSKSFDIEKSYYEAIDLYVDYFLRDEIFTKFGKNDEDSE